MNKALFGDRKDAWVINDQDNVEHVETIKATDEHLVYFLKSFARCVQEPRRVSWSSVFANEISAMEARRDRLQSEVDFWNDQITIAKRKGQAPERKRSLLYG